MTLKAIVFLSLYILTGILFTVYLGKIKIQGTGFSIERPLIAASYFLFWTASYWENKMWEL